MSVLDLFRLDGKVALVTGSAKGLGQALAIALAEAGAHIAGLDVLSCDATRQQVEAAGSKFLELTCDLKKVDVAGLNDVVREVVEAFGRLDILVNNAGITRPSEALNFTEEDYDAEAQINQKALFFLSQAAAHRMVEQGGGKIVNIASANVLLGGKMASSYTGTKSAVGGFTRAFACEWAPHNINVNAIAPGWIHTDNTENLHSIPELYTQIGEAVPAGRWSLPQDYMGTVVFLASSASDYLHGSMIIVDGGLVIS